MTVPKYLTPEINIKLTSEDCMPRRANPSDAGADLVCSEDVIMLPGVRTLVKTGVHVEIPWGFVGLLIPRSSLSKEGITMTNSVGVIDSDYRGELMASLMYNGNFENKFLAKGTRIVQLVVVPIILPEFKVVESLSSTARGEGGFGSTGVK